MDEIVKSQEKYINSEKSTCVSIYGLDEAKKQALFLCDKACDILNTNNIKSEILLGIVEKISEGINKCS